MNNVSLEELEQEKIQFLKDKELDDESKMIFQQQIKKVSKGVATELGKQLYDLISDKNYKDDATKAEPIILAGADLDYADEAKGNFALLVCAKKNYLKTFILLLKSGANINKVNRFLTSVAMLAARYGRVEIIDIICAMEADINTRSLDGDTALMSAKRHSKSQCFSRLTAANAHINARNFCNESVFKLVGTVNHPLFSSPTTKQESLETDPKLLIEEARKEMEQILSGTIFVEEIIKQKIISK